MAIKTVLRHIGGVIGWKSDNLKVKKGKTRHHVLMKCITS